MIYTTLCYIEKDDCYLMLHRVKKKNDINHDKWIGIGGKMESGETPEECIIREAFEETGLTLKAPEYRGVRHFKRGLSRGRAEVGSEKRYLFSSFVGGG